MIMDVKARGVTRRMSRLVRWLTGRNALRRPVDRIEGAVLVALSTALLVALAMADPPDAFCRNGIPPEETC